MFKVGLHLTNTNQLLQYLSQVCMSFYRRTLKLFQGRLLYSQHLHGISALDCPDGVNPALLWLWSKQALSCSVCRPSCASFRNLPLKLELDHGVTGEVTQGAGRGSGQVPTWRRVTGTSLPSLPALWGRCSNLELCQLTCTAMEFGQ